MARDRQRAKQRKARRAQNPGPAPSEPHRANVPGELEHASGEADEFDAALVSGAGGRAEDADGRTADAGPVADDDLSADAGPVADDELTEDALEADPAATGEIYADELGDDEELAEHEDPDDEALAREAVAAAPARRGRREPAAAETHRHTPARGPARFIAFLKASWAELQRVQWPDRRQVAQATAVVLGFVVVAGLYLGIADKVAQELVDLIL